MIIIDGERGRSSRIFGSRRVTLYRKGKPVRIFKTWRMTDAQAIARMWVRMRYTLAEIAGSWRATYCDEQIALSKARYAINFQIVPTPHTAYIVVARRA